MSLIYIDENKCTSCGLCAAACPEKVIEQPEGGLPQAVAEQRCISCGHCAAVCPRGALTHEAFPAGSVTPIDSGLLPGADATLELLRSRRSIRDFNDEPVSRELLQKVVDAARYAPSAHNLQFTHYTVVDDRKTLDKVTELTVDFYAGLIKQLRNPLKRGLLMVLTRGGIKAAIEMLPDFERIVAAHRDGVDAILHNAPALILFHSPEHATSSECTSVLAMHNAALACSGYGLGCFIAGFVMGACRRGRRVPELLGIPKDRKVFGVLAVGHPRVKFRSWVERKPAVVDWAVA